MVTKTITFKNLMEEINKLGFSEEDQVLLLADEETVTIKKLFPQGHSMFSSQDRFSNENKFTFSTHNFRFYIPSSYYIR